MKALIRLFVLLVSVTLFAENGPAKIKVLLHKDIEGALIEVKGAYKVFNPLKNAQLTSTWSGKRLYVQPTSKGIKWGKEFDNVYQIQIVPNDPAATILVDGIEYDGTLEVYAVEGSLYIVNETDVEGYVKSRMTHRFAHKHLSEQALEAIAICERTNAYYLAQKNSLNYWHATANDQYSGRAATLIDLSIDHAVDMTRQLIMTFHGTPFPALQTIHCGGTTSNYKTIFRKNASCPEGVESPIARKGREATTWRFKIHRDDLANLVKSDRITAIDLFIDNASKRTYAARLHSQGAYSDISFVDLQKRIGADLLKSNDFTVTLEKNHAQFEGFGEGHGIGLCLYSAEQMGSRGDSAEQILADFFPHTHLSQMKSLTEFQLQNFEPGAMQ